MIDWPPRAFCFPKGNEPLFPWTGLYRRLLYACLFTVLICLLPAGSRASAIPADTLSEQATASLLTVGPGAPLFTLFGHSAIRIHDPEQNLDLVFNYGTFNPRAEDFYMKFLRGNLNYFLSVETYGEFITQNTALHKTIKEQVLNLRGSQVQQIFDLLKSDLRPGRRYYQYRFFRQNCATKIRNLLILRIPVLSKTDNDARQNVTYRKLLNAYPDPHPWIKAGINLLLGEPADHRITLFQSLFLPDQLSSYLCRTHLAKDDSLVPAVLGSHIIYESHKKPTQGKTIFNPFFTFIILLVISAGISMLLPGEGIFPHIFDILLFGVTGLAGIILLVLSIFSLHTPLHRNWNILWTLPALLSFGSVFFPIDNFRLCWLPCILATFFQIGFLLTWPFLSQSIPLFVLPWTGVLIVRQNQPWVRSIM